MIHINKRYSSLSRQQLSHAGRTLGYVVRKRDSYHIHLNVALFLVGVGSPSHQRIETEQEDHVEEEKGHHAHDEDHRHLHSELVTQTNIRTIHKTTENENPHWGINMGNFGLHTCVLGLTLLCVL